MSSIIDDEVQVTLALAREQASQFDIDGIVKSRIGPLKFENGYPTEETVEKLFDELDFQRAVQAYLWAFPAISFESIRVALDRDLGIGFNAMGIADNFIDTQGLWLTANDTTIYAVANINLSEGAIVIEIPTGPTIGMICDFWQRAVTDVGMTGPDQGKGGRF